MLRAEALERAIERNDSCGIAKIDFWDAREEFNRYKVLVFIASCVFVAFLIGGIVLVAIGSDTRGEGIVSFVGSAASGVAMSFVIKRRNQASRDKDAAKRLVNTYCDTPQPVLEQLERGEAPV